MIPARRSFLFGSAAIALSANAGAAFAADPYASSPWRRISDADWKKRLPALSYRVLRHEDTEYPGTSALNKEKRRGTFVCLGCALPLFKSAWKYESGTGWPSFFDVYKANIGKKVDRALLEVRTEYHCARCLGHQGHIFDDGPKPTGLRYCNNGASIRFIPG